MASNQPLMASTEAGAPDAITDGAPASAATVNIEKLCAIDQTIVELMTHTASALESLGDSSCIAASLPNSDPPANSPPTAAERLQAFQTATESFLAALHSVDVRMKRQLWALEEADILRLGEAASGGADTAEGKKKEVKASLKPNAMGAFGGLDVGWLNSNLAGGGVDRDMETELWAKARAMLEGEGGGMEKQDVKMEGA